MERRKNYKNSFTPSDVSSRDSANNVHKDRASSDSSTSSDFHRGLDGDWGNIALLLFLYVLQGIPLGLAGSIPMILQNRKISYKEQALFSFVHWPFSVKLLWAPVVDSVFSERVGRRKSWMVPTQYLIGAFMLILSNYVTVLLGDDEHPASPSVFILTSVFFMLNFLAATQDIAVDGWALTMLSRHNVGYASTCNSVGQTAGYFLGNVVFLALESSDFCNRYLRSTPQDQGVVTLSGFLWFWGIVFLTTTTLVLILKRERSSRDCNDLSDMGIVDTYKMLYHISRLPSIKLFVLILLTCKIGFSATDAVTGLKLIEGGVHKEHLALIAIPMVPLQILLPFVISRYTAGPRPLDIFLKAFPYRLLLGLMLAGLVWWTHLVKSPDGTFPLYYYAVIILVYAVHQVTVYSIYVALMAFHARVSDPAIGGTYMTLLNTVTNLGGNWPATLALWFVDPLTYKSCDGGVAKDSACSGKAELEACTKGGGTCLTVLDGYYIEVMVCFVYGFLWIYWGRHRIKKLQHLPLSAWKCT